MTLESYSLNLAEDEDKWITVNSNGEGSGSHVKIDENGTVVAGMGGKFDGKNISNAHKSESENSTTSKSSRLTANEKSSLSTYSGDHFLDINSRLRKGEKADAEIQRIDSAIDKSTIPAQTLYRGMSREAAKKLFPNGEIKAGSVFSDKAFASTSTRKSIAGMNSIGGVMLQIESPEGAKGLDMSGISSNKQESEVLLPRNAKMQVVGTIPPKKAGEPVVVKVKYISGEEMAKDSVQSILAFDRASVRRIDQDGMLHIQRTPVTKACVNIYYGREIPDSEALGLEPNKAYRMLRCPDELRKAVPSFNRKPVLNTHLPVLASAPPKDAIIGSTGDNAEFDGTYLYNSMVVWDSSAIAGIESGQQREISSSYRYRADMTPGVYNGEEHDGVMRDIACNHEAIVPDGRAGPDVLVYDSKPKGYDVMSKLEKLWATILPRLAKDANPDEVKEEVAKLVEDEDDDKKDKPKTADDEQTQAEKDKESEAERLKEREDREKDEKLAKDSRLAMDELETRMRAQFRELREAEQMCEPIIGRVACDSAEEVYRMALKQKGVNGVDALHSSALKPMVEMLQNTKMAQDSAPVINSDSRSRVSSFLKGE